MTWRLVFTKQAQKDARNLSSAGLKEKAQLLLAIVAVTRFQPRPSLEMTG